MFNRREFACLSGLAATWSIFAKELRFPSRDFSIADYGGVPNDTADTLPAIRRAIAACKMSGGGRIVIPPGDYVVSGPVHLESNMNLYVAPDAILRFGQNAQNYLPTVQVRWEGTRCFNYSPLVYANGQRNIAITGSGVLDGQVQGGWRDFRNKQGPDQVELRRMGAEQTPLEDRQFGAGHYLRPQLVHFYDCRDVLIESVTLRNSPFWTLHLAYCNGVTIRKLKVLPGLEPLPEGTPGPRGANDDAIDIDSCNHVLIEDSILGSFDDCVVIKAGRDRDAWDGPVCENVLVRRSVAQTRAFGFVVGSEMSGGVRNVMFEDCRVEQASVALGVKSNTDRGGFVENIAFRRIAVKNCGNAIRVASDFQGIIDHQYPPKYSNLRFEQIECENATRNGIYIAGLRKQPIEGIRLNSVVVRKAGAQSVLEFTDDVRMRRVNVDGFAKKTLS